MHVIKITTMRNKIYIHIGFGKTGSSSIQSFLSFNPNLGMSGLHEKLLYCCFNNDGGISFGKELSNLAMNSPLKYTSSSPEVACFTNLTKTRDQLDKIFSAGYTPIFSQEDWGRRSSEFKNANFFSTLGCSAHVIAYVRPQVEWLNSAWWQWFAWINEFTKPGDIIDAWGYSFILWADQIAKWKTVPNVEGMEVRLQTSDVVADFMALLKIQNNPGIIFPERTNISLSPTLIKLLLRFPEIRNVHSAEVDVILSNLLKFEGQTPWIIDWELIDKIINATHADNQRLLGMLDENSRKLMANDPRWWDAGSYSNRTLYTMPDLKLSEQELFDIVGQAIPALIKNTHLLNKISEHDKRFTNQAPLIHIAKSVVANFSSLLRDKFSLTYWRKMNSKINLKVGNPYLLKVMQLYYAARNVETAPLVRIIFIVSIAYFIFPLDLVPDFLPIIGYLDDIALIVGTVYFFSKNITPLIRSQAEDRLKSLLGTDFELKEN